MSILNEFGKEVFDQTPVDYPIKFDRPTPIHLRIRDQILRVYNEMASSKEMDTPEEADDFTPDDDREIWENSPYECDFDHINDNKFASAMNAESSPHEDAETPQAKPEDSPKDEA